MTENEIGGLIVASLIIGILVAWSVYIIILAYKSNHEGKKSKKERIKELEHKIEVLEFKIENASGMRLRMSLFRCSWKLDYLKNNKINTIELPTALDYEFKKDCIIDEKGNKYKFDIDDEILIKIEKPTKKEK